MYTFKPLRGAVIPVDSSFKNKSWMCNSDMEFAPLDLDILAISCSNEMQKEKTESNK